MTYKLLLIFNKIYTNVTYCSLIYPKKKVCYKMWMSEFQGSSYSSLWLLWGLSEISVLALYNAINNDNADAWLTVNAGKL